MSVPAYMDLATLCYHLCAGESTIEGLVRQGKFPQPRYLGGKRLWRWSEVEATLDAQSAVQGSVYEATRKLAG